MSALIWSPFATREDARVLARILLEERLVACVNIVGDIESLFVWNGAIDEARECGVLFKTDESLLERAISRIQQLHPYETPVILGWRCDAAAEPTRQWLAALAKGYTDGSLE